MGFIFGITIRLLKLVIYIAVFVNIVALIPNLPPYTKFTSIKHEPPQPLVGPLALNKDLNNAEKLYVDKLLGPEAFQLYNGEVYTSLATSEIVKLSPGGHVTFVTKIGRPCSGILQEHICGRPLGFEIDQKTNQLYVVDTYHGIWKVDLKSDKKQLLVSPNVEIGGRKPKLPNFIALQKNGDFYWTDSSSDYQLKDGVFSLLSDPSGRLLHYNAAKNTSKVVLDDLWFANGVAISPDNKFVLVAETNRFRVMKYHIDGPKKGTSEVFVSGLPGTPDNIRALPDGSGVLVALYLVFDEQNPLLLKSISETPILRKVLARLQRMAEIPFEFLNTHFPQVIFEEIVYKIGHFGSVSGLGTGMSGLIQLDWNGNIVASYYTLDSANHISDAVVFNDKLYMGSPHNQNFIAAVPAPPQLKKAFATKPSAKIESPKHKVEAKQEPPKKVQEKTKVEEKKEVPKVAKPVVQEPPKPKQEAVKPTTPKPVTKPTQPPKQTHVKSEPTKPPKQPEPKATTATLNSEPKKAEPTPEKKKSEPTKPQPKQADPTPAPKPAQKQPETKPKQEKKDPKLTKQIPIKEDIPSDTVKPAKETLKVIKKAGPTEIPNPNL